MKKQEIFVENLSFRHMLHAFIVRSPIACGKLKEIKCPKLSSSYHLITADQIPGENKLADFPVPVLSGSDLSYIGQPIAILAGPDIIKLEDLASKIELDLEEEKPLFAYPAHGSDINAEQSPENVITRRDLSFGELEKVTNEEVKIISGTYTTGIQEHWYSEPHGAVAEPSSSLTIYTATQWPSHVRRSVAGILGLGIDKVKVHATLMALHLDGKIWYPSLIACQAALASWITGTPVKLMFTRIEDFMYSPKRNGAEIKISSALNDKGEISGSSVELKLDCGAAPVFEDEILDHSCLGALGVYNHRAITINGTALRTNIPSQGVMAGFGLAQGFFAAERHMSRIADSLGQDPAQYRKNYFLGKNQNLLIGVPLKDAPPLNKLIDQSAAMSDYYRKWASYELLRSRRRGQKIKFTDEPLRGIGISTAYQGNGLLYNNESVNSCGVELSLDKDGSLEIRTSLVSSGMGYLENWREMAMDILGVEPSLIRLKDNTNEAPDSGPGTLSRNIAIVTRLVELCCLAIRKQRFRDPLPITVKRSVKPFKGPGWVEGKQIDYDAFSRPGWGAAVVEVEIDPVSFKPGLRGIWFAVDGGKILSQPRAERALRTGIIHALGWTSLENLFYVNGKIPDILYQNYNIPAPAEIPPIALEFIQNENSPPKGIGDLPFCCVPAAYVQAVSQAMDHPFDTIPLDARDIWEAAKPEALS